MAEVKSSRVDKSQNSRICDQTEKFYGSIRNGNVEDVQRYLKTGALVNAQCGTYRITPLQLASYYGFPNIVEKLISRGAKIDAEDTLRRTPIFFAASAGMKEVIQALIQHNANVNIRMSNVLREGSFSDLYDVMENSIRGNFELIQALGEMAFVDKVRNLQLQFLYEIGIGLHGVKTVA